MDQRPLYLFLHIPKTGGTTLRTHLHTHLRNRFLPLGAKQFGTPEAYSSLSEQQLREALVVFGHGVSSETMKFFPDRDYRFVTVLRDPVERVISQYNWASHVAQQESGKEPPPFAEWFSTPFRHNTMARWLVSRHKYGVRGIPKTYRYPDLHEDARAVLRSCWLVGKCEELEPTVRPLLVELGAPAALAERRRVSGRDHPKFLERNDEVEKLIRAHALVDIALYDEFCRGMSPELQRLPMRGAGRKRKGTVQPVNGDAVGSALAERRAPGNRPAKDDRKALAVQVLARAIATGIDQAQRIATPGYKQAAQGDARKTDRAHGKGGVVQARAILRALDRQGFEVRAKS